MLQKVNRLVKKKDFDRVLRFGQGIILKDLGLKIIKNDLPITRFGFIVSNKIAKRANKRNKLKRRLRDIIRLKIKEKRLKDGLDAVVIARQGILDRTYLELKEEVEFGLNKLKILN
jgi:ribonuclease P protein component